MYVIEYGTMYIFPLMVYAENVTGKPDDIETF